MRPGVCPRCLAKLGSLIQARWLSESGVRATATADPMPSSRITAHGVNRKFPSFARAAKLPSGQPMPGTPRPKPSRPLPPGRRNQDPITEPKEAVREGGLGNESTVSEALRLKSQVAYTLTKLLEQTSDQKLKAIWQGVPSRRRSRIWSQVITRAGKQCPDRLQAIFTKSFFGSLPEWRNVRGALHMLSTQLPNRSGDDRAKFAGTLADMIRFVLDKASPEYWVSFKQATLYNILRCMAPTELARFYRDLHQHKHLLHLNTRLQFAGRLAGSPNTRDLAMEIAKDIPPTKEGYEDTRWQSFCTILLREASGDDSTRQSQGLSIADVFDFLMNLGFVPNTINYTQIMHRLCKDGQLDKAWAVVDVMREQHLDPDRIVVSILLAGAAAQGDADRIIEAIELAAEFNATDRQLWNEVLLAILRFSMVEAARLGGGHNTMLAPMLRFYRQLYTMEPLQQLLAIDPSEVMGSARLHEPNAGTMLVDRLLVILNNMPADAIRLETPQPITLHTMIRGFAKNAAEPYPLLAFYAHFCDLLKAENPIAKSLVSQPGSETAVYSVLLSKLVRFPGMMTAALNIVKEMATSQGKQRLSIPWDSLTGSATDNLSPSGTSVPHPAPDVPVWNCLLFGFAMHGGQDSAQKLMELMRRNGMEPDVVSYNALLSGKAWVGDVEGTIEALQSLQKDGFQPTERTYKAFSYLRDPEAALRIMDELIAKQQESPPQAPQAAINGIEARGL